jgi:putative PIN family toxin of toxin-antitoxin system
MGWNAKVTAGSQRDGKVELFTSIPLLAELTDVLNRQKFEKKIAASLYSVDQIVDRYAAMTVLVRPEPVSPTAVDPDDDVVIGTAQAAKAEFIVSGDFHLLTLKTFQDILIVTAATAIERIQHL